MSENNITIVLDKKSIVVAKTEIDITDKILKILDKDLKSINPKLILNARSKFFCTKRSIHYK